VHRLWEILEPARPGDRWSRIFDVFIVSLIALNVAATIAESVASIQTRFGRALDAFELGSLAVFAAEYLARVVSCVADSRFASPVRGRIRFVLTPLAIVDLLVILPFLLIWLDADLRSLRALRLLRVLRIARMTRYVAALRLFGSVARAKREELLLTSALMAMLLVMSSSLMYQVEHQAQPESFPSIPATMWWAVETLSTVGYGDVVPATTAGRVLGAIVAVLGIGFFALPTGILGSGFVEELQKRKKAPTCPHCGKPLEP
jgi:voltage-gated potassium channel